MPPLGGSGLEGVTSGAGGGGGVPDSPLILQAFGVVGAPELAFLGDEDTGLYRPAADQLGLVAGGVEAARVVEVGGATQMIFPQADTPAAPTVAFGDGDTGFYENSDDFLSVAVAGARHWVFGTSKFQGTTVGSGAIRDVLASAIVPTLLPHGSSDGLGIGALSTTAMSLIAGGVEIARVSNGSEDQFIVSPGQFLGSEALPALAIGDGDTGFYETFDDTLFITIGGTNRYVFANAANSLQGVVTGAGALRNEVSSATNPTLGPRNDDADTGIGSGTADTLSIIAGGVEIARAVEATGANQFIIAPGVIQNAAATPSLAFGDGNTGFFESADNTLNVVTGNAARFFWQANNFLAVNSAGPFIFNAAGTSGTTPIMGPNRSDNNTGIGHVANDNLSLIAGGIEGVRIEDPADLVAGETSLHIFDDDNAALNQVTIGAADSGGAGFKVLRIPN